MSRTNFRRYAVAAVTAATLAMPLSVSALASNNFDGLWSVVIITDSGTCDRAYRYPVRITNGALRHAESGDQNFVITGEVEPSGAVRGSVRRSSNNAAATGRLTATAGSGTWKGAGSGGSCAGHWEAERRDDNHQTNGRGG